MSLRPCANDSQVRFLQENGRKPGREIERETYEQHFLEVVKCLWVGAISVDRCLRQARPYSQIEDIQPPCGAVMHQMLQRIWKALRKVAEDALTFFFPLAEGDDAVAVENYGVFFYMHPGQSDKRYARGHNP